MMLVCRRWWHMLTSHLETAVFVKSVNVNGVCVFCERGECVYRCLGWWHRASLSECWRRVGRDWILSTHTVCQQKMINVLILSWFIDVYLIVKSKNMSNLNISHMSTDDETDLTLSWFPRHVRMIYFVVVVLLTVSADVHTLSQKSSGHTKQTCWVRPTPITHSYEVGGWFDWPPAVWWEGFLSVSVGALCCVSWVRGGCAV